MGLAPRSPPHALSPLSSRQISKPTPTAARLPCPPALTRLPSPLMPPAPPRISSASLHLTRRPSNTTSLTHRLHCHALPHSTPACTSNTRMAATAHGSRRALAAGIARSHHALELDSRLGLDLHFERLGSTTNATIRPAARRRLRRRLPSRRRRGPSGCEGGRVELVTQCSHARSPARTDRSGHRAPSARRASLPSVVT